MLGTAQLESSFSEKDLGVLDRLEGVEQRATKVLKGLEDLQRPLPTSAIPWFCNSGYI